MPWWKFWERTPEEESDSVQTTEPVIAPRARGFDPPPPRFGDSSTAQPSADIPPAQLKQLESLGRELERAESAALSANEWSDQIAVIDEAISSIEQDIRDASAEPDPMPEVAVAGTIDVLNVNAEAPAKIELSINGRKFQYQELQDWGERGFNVVRGDLEKTEGDVDTLAGENVEQNSELISHLDESMLRLATKLRDDASSSKETPSTVPLFALAETCPECGGYRLYEGPCPRCDQRQSRLRELQEDRRRMFTERDDLIREQTELIESLPMLKRRLAALADQLGLERDVAH